MTAKEMKVAILAFVIICCLGGVYFGDQYWSNEFDGQTVEGPIITNIRAKLMPKSPPYPNYTEIVTNDGEKVHAPTARLEQIEASYRQDGSPLIISYQKILHYRKDGSVKETTLELVTCVQP